MALLSEDIHLREMVQPTEALAGLAAARRQIRDVADAGDLEHDHLWGPRALAALAALRVEETTRDANLTH